MKKELLEQAQAEMKARNQPKPKAKSGSEATQFQPGESGNPNGRPKAILPTSAGPVVRRYLGKMADSRRNNYEAIIENLGEIAKSEKHNLAVRAAEELLDRAFGKPVQQIDQNVTVTSREEDLQFLKEQLGLTDHGSSSESIQ
jgi:hypothetical protein